MIPTHRAPLNILTETYIVMRISGLDDDWTLLLLVGEVFLNVFLSTGVCASFTHRM